MSHAKSTMQGCGEGKNVQHLKTRVHPKVNEDPHYKKAFRMLSDCGILGPKGGNSLDFVTGFHAMSI